MTSKSYTQNGHSVCMIFQEQKVSEYFVLQLDIIFELLQGCQLAISKLYKQVGRISFAIWRGSRNVEMSKTCFTEKSCGPHWTFSIKTCLNDVPFPATKLESFLHFSIVYERVLFAASFCGEKRFIRINLSNCDMTFEVFRLKLILLPHKLFIFLLFY